MSSVRGDNVWLRLKREGSGVSITEGECQIKKQCWVILQDESQYRQSSEGRLSPFLKRLTVTVSTLKQQSWDKWFHCAQGDEFEFLNLHLCRKTLFYFLLLKKEIQLSISTRNTSENE